MRKTMIALAAATESGLWINRRIGPHARSDERYRSGQTGRGLGCSEGRLVLRSTLP